MPNIKNRMGQRLGLLEIIDFFECDKNGALWLAVCDCGNLRLVNGISFTAQTLKPSCGCYSLQGKSSTHGLSRSRLYKTWRGMSNRCSDPSRKHYHGRGITVCGEWSTFEPFSKWALDNGYNDLLTIDRIDVHGDYRPENCRWATWKEQAINKAQTKLTQKQVEEVKEWSNRGIPQSQIAGHFGVSQSYVSRVVRGLRRS